VRTLVAGMIIAVLTSTAWARTRRAWEAAWVARAKLPGLQTVSDARLLAVPPITIAWK
jgi:hypothetical protein